MGPSLLNADQLDDVVPLARLRTGARLPALNNDVRALAQIFITKARSKACAATWRSCRRCSRPAGSSYSDNGQIRPEFNNYAGINANDGRRKGTTCADEVLDAAAQVALLPDAADRRAREHPLAARLRRPALAQICTGRIRMPPSDRIGIAPIWEYFGGNSPTRQAHLGVSARLRPPHHPAVLGGAGAQRRTRPVPAVLPGQQRPEVRQRLLDRRRATPACTRSGRAAYYGDPGEPAAEPAAHQRRGALGRHGLLADGPRRRHLLVRQRAVLRLDGWPAAEPAGQRDRTHRTTTRATGSSRTTAASSPSATRSSTARWAAST